MRHGLPSCRKPRRCRPTCIVPYCTEPCLYCGCTTKAERRRAPVETYAEHVLKDIELLGCAIGGRRVAHLHWGGGTPPSLTRIWREITSGTQLRCESSARSGANEYRSSEERRRVIFSCSDLICRRPSPALHAEAVFGQR